MSIPKNTFQTFFSVWAFCLFFASAPSAQTLKPEELDIARYTAGAYCRDLAALGKNPQNSTANAALLNSVEGGENIYDDLLPGDETCSWMIYLSSVRRYKGNLAFAFSDPEAAPLWAAKASDGRARAILQLTKTISGGLQTRTVTLYLAIDPKSGKITEIVQNLPPAAVMADGGKPDSIQPDSDGDGITDKNDDCPGEYGTAASNGCPEPKPSDGNYTENAFGLSLDMIMIKGGTFTMGSPASEVNHESEEMQHQVSLSSFYMGKTEVTQNQWRAVMGSNPSKFSDCGTCPVEQVSWEDVQLFIQKLNAQTGKSYRLPTEAEWEYAARAGSTTPFSTGNNLSTDQANYNGDYPYNGNAKGVYRQKNLPAGSFSANAFGLYDMHGNVWEWCNDWYAAYPSGSQSNPTGPSSGTYRVDRGGSYGNGAQNCRSGVRYYNSPSGRDFNLGFRLAAGL